MEPRGESAMLIFPRDVSVNREGERCGPRRGDGVGSSFGSATFPAFLQIKCSPLPAVGTVITPLLNRCVAFAFSVPRFPGLSREPLKLTFPALFRHLQDDGENRIRSLRFLLGLYLPTTAVGERGDRKPMGR